MAAPQTARSLLESGPLRIAIVPESAEAKKVMRKYVVARKDAVAA